MNRLFHRRAMLSLSGGLIGSALLTRSAPAMVPRKYGRGI